MKRETRWVLAVVMGLAWGTTTTASADDPAGPNFPQRSAASRGDRKTVWQITITPSAAPAVVADFYEESDGSLSVIHRPADGVTGPATEQLAPPPAPATPAPKSAAANSGTVLFAVKDDEPADEKKAKPEPEAKPGDGAAPAPGVVATPLGPEMLGAGEFSGGPAWGTGPRMSYLQAYFSVPFLRSEYNANPSYRHEAAMEIMFGQLRPTVVHKYVPPPVVQRYDYNYITPYAYSLNGRGASYNFFYPRPSVYRHY